MLLPFRVTAVDPASRAAGVQKLKDANPAGVLLGSGKLATELDRLELIDEYKILVHPRIAGHGPTLYQDGLTSTRQLELVSAKPLRCGAVAMPLPADQTPGNTRVTDRTRRARAITFNWGSCA